MGELVKIRREGHVARLTINREEKRNALNAEVVSELQVAFDTQDLDPEIRVIVLTGEGSVFCAGADLAYLQMINENSVLENAEDSEALMRLMYSIRNSSTPTIAKINGHAIAGGFGLALTCDILVAVDSARFGFTEVRIGFVPAIVMKLAMERAGMGRARELLLRGHLINTVEAETYGLINHVVAADKLDESVQSIAEEFATQISPQAAAMTKRLMSDVAHRDLYDAMHFASRQNAISRETDDFSEGIASFLEKRKPHW
ncbi:enoyl-CoA hydratase/isomerase family protein [bacterium]|nr:enoyl-CoA hydratase/isomerase family protein [bacterium]